jgi:hypothetical protein
MSGMIATKLCAYVDMNAVIFHVVIIFEKYAGILLTVRRNKQG